MPNFLYDNVALNGAKVNLNALPGGADPNKYADAGLDWNPTIAAINDLRGGILSNMFLGIDTQASAPAVPVGGVNFFLWADSSGDLYWRKHGTGDQKLNAQAAAAVTSITAGIGLNGGTITTAGTIDLANTAVTPGAYTNANITVDSTGRIIAAANGVVGALFPFAATVGSWDQGVLSEDATNANFMSYAPNDAGTTSWYQWASSFANSGGRRNQVMRFGWNLGGGGARVTTGANNGALGSEYEQYFESSGNHMERHEVYIDPTGRLTRWLSFDGRLDTPYTTRLHIASDALNMYTGASTADPLVFSADTTSTKVWSNNGFDYLILDNTQARLQAGTTVTATAHFTAQPGGDVTIQGTRGFFGGTSTGVRFGWSATAADIFSPDGNTDLFVANGDMQHIVGGTQYLRLTGSLAAFGVPAKWAPTVGTYKIGNITDPGTNARLVQYIPNDASTTTWVEGVNSEANTPGPRRNQTMTMGWNLDVGGGRLASGALNGALGLSFEQYYETVGVNKVMEQHNIYVSPADVQTRYISFMGNLEAPYNTALYIYSTTLTLGSGENASDVGSIFVSATTTMVTTPVGYARLTAEDSANTVGIYNGDAGDTDRGHLIIYNTGEINGDTSLRTRLTYNGAVITEVSSNGVQLASQDGSSAVGVFGNGTGPQFYAGGGFAKLSVQTNQIFGYLVPYVNEMDGGGASTTVVGLMAQNNTAAANGAQQYSPALFLRGMGWKSDATAASQANGWYVQAQPVQGTAASSVNLSMGASINEAAPLERFLLTSAGYLTVTHVALADTQTPGLRLANLTAAAAAAQQYSPMAVLEGQGWKTDATAASQSVRWATQARPVEGAASPSGDYVFWQSINGAAYVEQNAFYKGALQFYDNGAEAREGALHYDSGAGAFQVSLDGVSWVNLLTPADIPTLATIYTATPADNKIPVSSAGGPVIFGAVAGSIGSLLKVQNNTAVALFTVSDNAAAYIAGAAANSSTNKGVVTNAVTALLDPGRPYLSVQNGGTEQWAFSSDVSDGTVQQIQCTTGAKAYIDGNGDLTIHSNNAHTHSYVQLASDQADLIAGSGASAVARVQSSGNVLAQSSHADGASAVVLMLNSTSAWSNATAKLLSAKNNSVEKFAIMADGIPMWSASANVQTTVGAAGGASAPPATPTKYIKVKDDAGTTYVIPAYAAA